MPYAKQLRDLLDKIATCEDPIERRTLMRQFGEALEHRFTQVNSKNAVALGAVENSVNDTLLAIKQQLVVILQEISTNRDSAAIKAHQLSNYVMALENKVDELAQLVMLKNPYD